MKLPLSGMMKKAPEPLADRKGRLGWLITTSFVYTDPAGVSLQLIPRFPECNPAMDDTDVVSDLCQMVDDLVTAGTADCPVVKVAPETDCDDIEQLARLCRQGPMMREPILPTGTRLAFGIVGEHLLMIDGQPDRGWPSRLFTRWSAAAAFERWMSFVARGWVVKYQLGADAQRADTPACEHKDARNRFFLLRAADRADCDAAGEEFARILGTCLAEDETSSGVTISHSACRAPAALK